MQLETPMDWNMTAGDGLLRALTKTCNYLTGITSPSSDAPNLSISGRHAVAESRVFSETRSQVFVRTCPRLPMHGCDALSERNQFQNLIAGAKWQVFSEGGNAESLSCFSSFSIDEKSGGMDSSLPAYSPIPNVLIAFPTPSSMAIVCNSNSSFPCAAYTKRKCFSGKSKKCFWIIKRTKFLTLSGLTLFLQVGTSVKDIGRLGYARQTREPSP